MRWVPIFLHQPPVLPLESSNYQAQPDAEGQHAGQGHHVPSPGSALSGGAVQLLPQGSPHPSWAATLVTTTPPTPGPPLPSETPEDAACGVSQGRAGTRLALRPSSLTDQGGASPSTSVKQGQSQQAAPRGDVRNKHSNVDKNA